MFLLFKQCTLCDLHLNVFNIACLFEIKTTKADVLSTCDVSKTRALKKDTTSMSANDYPINSFNDEAIT
jgi:hypothetical protein